MVPTIIFGIKLFWNKLHCEKTLRNPNHWGLQPFIMLALPVQSDIKVSFVDTIIDRMTLYFAIRRSKLAEGGCQMVHHKVEDRKNSPDTKQ